MFLAKSKVEFASEVLRSDDVYGIQGESWRNLSDSIALHYIQATLADVTGIPELVIDNETGLLTKPGDANELAQAIIKVCGNQNLRNKIILNAVAKVEQEFSLMTNAQHLDQLFKSVVPI